MIVLSRRRNQRVLLNNCHALSELVLKGLSFIFNVVFFFFEVLLLFQLMDGRTDSGNLV
jgi:hypothetical protein